jgi:hypothetical protein
VQTKLCRECKTTLVFHPNHETGGRKNQFIQLTIAIAMIAVAETTILHNNIRKAECVTNRLLYQLSYVGLSSILNGRPESVKQQAHRRCNQAGVHL